MNKTSFDQWSEKMMNPMAVIARASMKALTVAMVVLLMVPLITTPQSWGGDGNALLPETQAQAQGTSSTGRCGTYVALVVDLSRTTVGREGNSESKKLSGIKQALNGLVNSYANQPVNLGIYTFATTSPAGGNRNFSPQSLVSADAQSNIRDYINDLQLAPAGLQAETNWEGGLQRVLTDMEAGDQYGNVYLITDSMPTHNEAGFNSTATGTDYVELTSAQSVAEDIAQRGAVVHGIGATQRFHNGTRHAVRMPGGNYQQFTYEASLDMITTGQGISNTSTYNQLPSHIRSHVSLPAANSGCLTVESSIVDGQGQEIAAGSNRDFQLEVTSAAATFPNGREVQVQTNPRGSVETRVEGISLSQPARITVTSVATSDYQIRPAGTLAAKCYSTNPNGTISEVATRAVPNDPNSVSVPMRQNQSVTCEFAHRPLISMQLQKQVEVNTPQLQHELNNLEYGFTYICTDADETRVLIDQSGDGVSIPVSTPHEIGRVPLGASCTITESVTNQDPDRFDATTSWQVNDAVGNRSGTEPLTYTVTPTAEAYTNGAPVLVNALNSFRAFDGKIKIQSTISNAEALPAGRLPESVPIRYFCRYVPDPNNPPEQGSDGTANPYHVADGYTSIPRGGEVEIGPFPVGTQCGFEQISPSDSDESSLIHGFSMSTVWNSDICLYPGSNENLVRCESNFFWLPTTGVHHVEVQNSYMRQTTDLEVTQRLTGDAAYRGEGQNMTVNVRCVDEGKEVFNRDISVLPDLPIVVRDVPVASQCTVVSTENSISGVTMDAAPSTVDIDSPSTLHQVEISSILTALLGEVWLTKRVNITELWEAQAESQTQTQDDAQVAEAAEDLAAALAPEAQIADEDLAQTLVTLEEAMDAVAEDPSTDEETLQSLQDVEEALAEEPGNDATADVRVELAELAALVETPVANAAFDPGSLLVEQYPVEARCWIPGREETTIWNGMVTHEVPQLVGAYPVGTTCSFRETYTAPAGLDHHPTFTPPQVTVEENRVDVELRNRFNLQGAGLMLHYDVVTSESIPDWGNIWDNNLYVDYQCADGPVRRINLGDPEGHMELADDVYPAGTACTFTFDNSGAEDAGLVNRVTTWDSPNSAAAVTTGELHSNDLAQSFSVIVPDNLENNRLIVNFHHEFTPVRAEISMDKVIDFDIPEGSGFDPALAEAIFPDNHAVYITYVCTRNETELMRGAVVFDLGETARINAPVGAECVLAPGERVLVGAELTEVSASGDGEWFSDPERIVIDHAEATPKEVTIRNVYQLQLGGFNLKKKVDGEGVATIHSNQLYDISYECTLNGQSVAGGRVEIGRFDTGEQFPVTNVIVGSDCAVREEPETSGEAHASWQARWAVAEGADGWGAEQSCENLDNCSWDRDTHYQAVLTVNEISGAGPAGHFQGTFVVWNTIHYDKARVQVAQELKEDGPDLAATRDFAFTLVCTDPNYTDELVELDYISDPTIWQSVTITGTGDVIAPTPIPVNYECTLTQEAIAPFDAEVSVSFEGAERSQEIDPATGDLAVATFSISPENTSPDPGGKGDLEELEPQVVTVYTAYDRIRAEVSVETRIGEWPGQVDEYLDLGDSTVNWRCVDPYTDAVYQGETIVKPIDGAPVRIRHEDRDLPASVECSFTEIRSVTYPEGFEDIISANSMAGVFWGDEVNPSLTAFDSTISEVELSAEGTRVEFTNYDWVEQIDLGLNKVIDGDPDNSVFPVQETFSFQAVCTVNNVLPGQTVEVDGQPAEFNGSQVTVDFNLADGQGWYTGLIPTGSTCEFTETLTPAQEARLEELDLNLSQTYSTIEGESEDGDSARVIVDGPVQVSKALRDVLFFNSFYRADGEVQVWKVNADDSPLEGARFALYNAVNVTEENPRGELAQDPLVQEMGFVPRLDGEGEVVINRDGNPEPDFTKFTARLKPGSYFLVETQSGTGAELLPAPWQFSLESTNDGELGDLQFRLSTYDVNSGLVEVDNPDKEDESPSIIKVANVLSGELPLTGGFGVWKILGGGGALFLLALVWFCLRKRLS